MSRIESFLDIIDLLNSKAGKAFSFMILPLSFVTAFEVVMRYIFNRPTIWAWDIAVQLGALLGIFGGGYTLLHNSHIVIDVFVMRLSPRARALLDVITGLLFFFAFVILLWKSAGFAWRSFLLREGTSSYWNPAIYPLKMTIPIGVFLFLLQGVAKFIRDLDVVIHGEGGRKIRP